MTRMRDLFVKMIEKDASDLILRAGSCAWMRIHSKLEKFDDETFSVDDLMRMVNDIIDDEKRQQFKKTMNIEFAIYLEDLGRFRASLFVQRNSPAIVIRRVRKAIQTFDELNLPTDILRKLSFERRGIVLLTGAAGSGKSTTIASMIEYINQNTSRHILAVEEPIEFTFEDKKSIIHQREIGLDVASYPDALKHFTYQSPDVIFVGNIRDIDTMAAVITAAETGVLVLSTLHTVNAAQTTERIINFFPPYQHEEVRMQLSLLLKGVISLRLIPRKDQPGCIPAYEVMLLTPTISRLIREGKVWEIPSFIHEGEIFGMQTFRQSIAKLIRDNIISIEDGMEYCDNRDELELELKGIKRL
ncbi:MAG: PilT/PilU family type 4a pilus ATPase [Candidatus Omnitrophota bacterium]